ncbi:hypothetical protein AB0C02_10280 [Micromonospora sp. NPDC048999]|uniref:hypothetical protein n=1 Tax=Micromonospora sp. NPDC048999 TaxID=3155391 RepID=UPI0033D2BF9E
MDRRSILRAAVAGAIAVPVAGLLGAVPAEAATHYVMATEQASGRILRFNPASWTSGTVLWQAPSRTGTWTNLSDVKRRATAKWGNVMLVTASGAGDYRGQVAMIRESSMSSSKTGGIVWQATVTGNPHSIERIATQGAIVVATTKGSNGATSGGGLHLFVPSSNGGTPGTKAVQFIKFPGAHGVIYNQNGFIIAVGDGEVRLYGITGNGSSTRLQYRTKYTFSDGTGKARMGHDILPDYKGGGYFFTSSYKVRTLGLVYAGNSWQFTAVSVASSTAHVKAYTRLPNGVKTWIVPGSGEGEWSKTIRFSSGNHSKSGARFYRVRYYTTAFA